MHNITRILITNNLSEQYFYKQKQCFVKCCVKNSKRFNYLTPKLLYPQNQNDIYSETRFRILLVVEREKLLLAKCSGIYSNQAYIQALV